MLKFFENSYFLSKNPFFKYKPSNNEAADGG